MAQLSLVVRFTLRPGRAEAFDELMRETVAGIAAHEPRTVAYAVHAPEGEPDVRVFYELYADDAALDEHEQQPTTRAFLDRLDEFAAEVVVERLRVVTATGVAAG